MKLSIKNVSSSLLVLMCCSLMVLSGCKKSSSSNYTVSVNASGLVGTGLVLQMNSAYNLPILTNGTAVATFDYQLPNNTAYYITIVHPPGGPNQTCTVANASGVVSGANVTNVNVVCAPTEYAYLTNFAANTVVPYDLDLSNGVLTLAGSPTPTGSGPVAFAISLSGRYAYALNQTDMTVSAYLANASSGFLLSAGAVGTGSASVAAVMPNAIAVDPSNQYVYVTDFTANSISGFTINATSAALTCIGINSGTCPVNPVMPGVNAPTAMVMTGSGTSEYLFVTSASGNVYEYSITGTGTLSLTNSIATGSNPVAIAATPGTGAYVYVVNAADGSVSGYTNISGTLSSTGAAVLTAGATPGAIAIHPAGTFAYVVNQGSNTMSVFSISASGTLTLVGTPVATGSMPVSVSVDPTGAYVFVANKGDGSVDSFPIAKDGTIGTAVVQVLGNSPVSIVTVASDLKPL